jgi:hypothetical protein
MINYFIMKPSLRNSHWIAVLCLLLMAGCATPEGNNATSNNNAAPAAEAANANTSPTAQPATPLASNAPSATAPAPSAAAPAPSAVPAQPPIPETVHPTPEPAAKPAAKADAAHAEGPKLVVVSQEKDLDFGKQPQDKTLVRPIRIKNGGSQTLNIESVSPS